MIYKIFQFIPHTKLENLIYNIASTKNNDFSQIYSQIKKIFENSNYASNLNEFLFYLTVTNKSANLLFNNQEKIKLNELYEDYKNFLPYSNNNSLEKIMRYDLEFYLPNDILCKTDRASMYQSLEFRSPFLDHLIVENQINQRERDKLKNGIGKLQIRHLLSKYMPDNVISNTKKGFAVPLSYWLRKDLKHWSENLIFNNEKKYCELINFKNLKKLWKKHQNNKEDNSSQIWNALVLIDWLKKYH